MPNPRRELSAAEIQAVCTAYTLGDPVRWQLAYEGTSSLYRLECTGPRVVAVKVQDGGESVSAAKSLEAAILSRLRPIFPAVPVLLRPGAASPAVLARYWGLEVGRFAVSVYEWVQVALRWQWDAEQRRATVQALGQLQRGLAAIGTVTGARFRPSALDLPFTGFVREFAAAEAQRRRADPDAGLDPSQLDYLDDRFQLLHRDLLADWRRLAESSTGLAHADFTPGNCGYAADGALTIVFDFESVRRGVLPLFGAISVGAFSINPDQPAGTAVAAVREMVDGLRNCCPPLSSPAGQTLPLLRLAYLDAARRQLQARKENPVRRWSFLKQDIANLHWLDRHETLLAGI